MYSTERGNRLILIVCVDDSMGMMFNKRRVSRDEAVIKRIIEIADNKRIWMSQYSYPLFESMKADNIVAEDLFLERASNDEYCFLENISVADCENKIERIILFRWNRSYPSDVKFNIDLNEWKFNSSEEFAGDSHECITMEVYSK